MRPLALPFGLLGLVGLAGLVGTSACRRSVDDANARPAVASSASIHSAELPVPPKPNIANAGPVPSTGIETVSVPNDRAILVVVGADTGRPIVHLHGMCSEARSDLDAWSSSVRAHGTILALRGDTSCSSPTDNAATWTSDVTAIDKRIDEAIAAVQTRGISLDPREVVLVGESMGASRAEALAGRFPAKYPRLVLIGSPQAPSPKNLEQASAVALLAGEKEPQKNMTEGAETLAQRGMRARFWELPGAVHGAYGPDGDRIMGDAVAFVSTSPPK